MKCPYCDAEMKDGYLQSARYIVWSPGILHTAIIPRGGEDFRASKGTFEQILRSRYCAKCNILISVLREG